MSEVTKNKDGGGGRLRAIPRGYLAVRGHISAYLRVRVCVFVCVGARVCVSVLGEMGVGGEI